MADVNTPAGGGGWAYLIVWRGYRADFCAVRRVSPIKDKSTLPNKTRPELGGQYGQCARRGQKCQNHGKHFVARRRVKNLLLIGH